jgi:transcriptional regulatory protein LevR
MALIHDIEAAKREKKITSALFIDVRAFDNVSKACLLETMAKFGLPEEITSWTNHLMTDRYTKLSFDDQSDSLKPINTGVH